MSLRPEDFHKLPKMTKAQLIARGLFPYGRGHWLFRAEWYDVIPNGLPIVDTFGVAQTFARGVTGDDNRAGEFVAFFHDPPIDFSALNTMGVRNGHFLPYGMMRPEACDERDYVAEGIPREQWPK